MTQKLRTLVLISTLCSLFVTGLCQSTTTTTTTTKPPGKAPSSGEVAYSDKAAPSGKAAYSREAAPSGWWPGPPSGFVDIAKTYINTMANRMAGWGGSAGSNVTKGDRSMMTKAMNRIEDFERTMSKAKDKAVSGLDTARQTSQNWANRALNWLTGR